MDPLRLQYEVPTMRTDTLSKSDSPYNPTMQKGKGDRIFP